MDKIIKLLIIGTLVIATQACVLGEQADEKKLTKLLVDSFIVEDFEAKNISVAEACKKLNELFIQNQKNIGSLSRLGIFQIELQKTPQVNRSKVFLHVKRIKMSTILAIICEQGQLSYQFEKNKIKIFYPVEQ